MRKIHPPVWGLNPSVRHNSKTEHTRSALISALSGGRRRPRRYRAPSYLITMPRVWKSSGERHRVELVIQETFSRAGKEA